MNDIDIARLKRDKEKTKAYEMVVDFMVDDLTLEQAKIFVLGVEFWDTITSIRNGWRGSKPIHIGNKARLLSSIEARAEEWGVSNVSVSDTNNFYEWAELTVE
jgi:hypothetical protein